MIIPMKISVKQNNRKIILDLFRKSGILSVGDLAEKTRISKPTVHKIISFFEEKGMLVLERKGASTDEGGKRPNLYRFSPDFGRIISLHVGPDFIYSAISNMQADIIHSHHFEIGGMDSDWVLNELGRIILEFIRHEAIENSHLVSIAVALPGIVDPKKGISVFTPHYVNWGNNIPFMTELRKRTGLNVPIYIDCTNRFQAVAEKEKGVAKDSNNFIILDAMKEGIGSGVFVNGTLRHGSHNLSGEVGHMVLEPNNGPKCICGGNGCFERMVSFKRIQELVATGKQTNPGSMIFDGHIQEQVELNAIYIAAKKNDPLAREIINDICKWFAQGINNIIMVNDPELVVLQGVYNLGGESFLQCLKEKINTISLPYINRKVEILFSCFGLERGVVGGACYCFRKYFEDPFVYK